MANHQMLNNVDHKDIKVRTGYSSAYGDNLMFCMIFPFEFRSVQSCYPILFSKSATDQPLMPVALFGFESGENLFLSDAGWDAPYIPAMIRRQPFMIGFQQSEANPSSESQRVMSIDTDNPRVNTEEGEALFYAHGGRTEYLQNSAALLESIYEGNEHRQAFVRALENLDLLESISMDITLADGSKNQLLGFYGLNEEKVQALDGDVLGMLSRQGFLMPLFMVLASLSNMGALIQRKSRLVC